MYIWVKTLKKSRSFFLSKFLFINFFAIFLRIHPCSAKQSKPSDFFILMRDISLINVLPCFSSIFLFYTWEVPVAILSNITHLPNIKPFLRVLHDTILLQDDCHSQPGVCRVLKKITPFLFCLKNLKPNAHIFKHIFFIVQIFAENESLLKEPDTA